MNELEAIVTVVSVSLVCFTAIILAFLKGRP